MVHRNNYISSHGANALSVLNGDRDNVVVVEEFPRVVERTEIVRLKEEQEEEKKEEEEEIKTSTNVAECLPDRQEVQQQQQQQRQRQRQRQRNRRSGRFSLFNWFKKGNDFEEDKTVAASLDNNGLKKDREEKGSELDDRIYSSSGSVDTTCSTATVHSFTFRSGPDIDTIETGGPRLRQYLRKHLSADNFASPITTAARSSRRTLCVDQFDSEPSIVNAKDRDNCSLKNEKHNENETRCGKSVNVDETDENIVGRNVNKTILDDKSKDLYNFYRSLPTAGKTADLNDPNKKRYSHVRGKRQAPQPPTNLKSEKTNTPKRNKRQAPKPPIDKIENKLETKKCDIAITKNSDDLSWLKNEEKFHDNPTVVLNDTLKLEGGILLPIRKSLTTADMNQVIRNDNKQKSRTESDVKKSTSSTTSVASGNAVLPRPWYKRSNTTLSERDICGSFRREVLKIPTLSKSSRQLADKGTRFSIHNENTESRRDSGTNNNTAELNTFDKSFSRLNHLFGRSENACKTKKEDKRKSNLSILTNISELDREAAAIVQKEQARNQAMSKSLSPSIESNEFDRSTNGADIISEMVSASIEPQRRGTRALISKFNAISNNITKVTVNSTFFNKSPVNKIDVVRSAPENRTERNIITKRLQIRDGNEAGDISSINFFRRLEAEASKMPDNNNLNNPGASNGWEEKIKRYFPERVVAGKPRNDKEESKPTASGAVALASKQRDENYILKDRELRNFQLHDSRSIDNKMEQLSRADLKEMLIEMKHSLPKRPKAKSAATSGVVASSGTSLVVKNNDRVSSNDEKVKRLESSKDIKISSNNNKPGCSKFESRSKNIHAAATSGEKLENEKKTVLVPNSINNNNNINNNRIKVSSGVQTSANIRKVDIKTPVIIRERQENITRIISNKPVSDDTIHTTKGRQTNANSGGVAALGRNTFQLIRPRDFACIEALKTEKGKGAVVKESQNTYMNVIEDSIYANAVINTPKLVNGDEKCVRKIDIVGKHDGMVDNNDRKNVISDINDRAENSEPETLNDRCKLETRKSELGILGRTEKLSEKRKTAEEEKGMSGPSANMNTMAINRLLRKLEGAIASGQHQQAAGLAKELAQLKIHCSVVRQRSGNDKASDFINVDMYIEDKLAHQGPIPLQLSLNMTVAELKNKVFAEFEIPANVQRWIIGKNLADDDNFTINELKAVDRSSIFLYLVAPDLQNDECTRVDKPVVVKEEVTTEIPVIEIEELHAIPPILEEEPEVVIPKEPTVEELKLKRYEHLMSLENSDVIPNSVPIECPICFAPYGPCEGVILRDCLHMFCRSCIANTIMYCEEAEVKCPFRDSEYTCESTLQEREIKALVTAEIYEQHLAKSVSQAENNAGNNAFHCKTPDCPGWCIYDDNVNIFLCPVCSVNNCLTCQAIHTNKNCREYQDEIRLLKETDQETKRTAAVLEEMVESGEALACPTCAVVLMKKWGCDWLRCSMCKTEICWVTRGPRWGPAGKGDTSGGCKCGENGVKCHPRCNYCH